MDREVRDLERRWRASNDPHDEAAWHVARVRGGQLAPERVELAAVLGHEAAALAATTLAPPATSRGARKRRDAGLPAWSDELPRFGYLPALRAAIALLDLVRPAYAAALPRTPRPPADHQVQLETLFDRGLAALAAYAVDPGPATRAATQAVDEEEQRASSALLDAMEAGDDAGAGPLSTDTAGVGPCFDLLETLHTALDPLSWDEEPTRARGWFLAVVRDVSRHVEAAALDDAVRAALIPWALGLADPLRPAG